MMNHAGTLDEAYERLHRTGPEWGGNLANHGPMAAEVLARRGRSDQVNDWLDSYLSRLDEMPSPANPVTDGNWRESLGGHVADWTVYMSRQVTEQPWRDVLATWWPRLLPGIAAGATHGVIRTGHAVRTLLAEDESAAAVTELAHGLAYWAARARPVPGVTAPSGIRSPAEALDAIPRIAEQRGPIRARLARLTSTPGWTDAVTGLAPAATPGQAADMLAELVTAATLRYLRDGASSPVLLIHAATAPNAVLHTLPALPDELWAPSLTAAWAASAAITATYAAQAASPAVHRPVPPTAGDPVTEILDLAVRHGDEHVIKFSDTAAEAYIRSGNPGTLAAAVLASQLIESRG